MTQLEISTQIFCSGKGYTIDESWTLAGGLMLLEALEKSNETSTNTYNEDYIPDLFKRTADRTQQLIDLGFEWHEEHNCFEQDNKMVITSDIDSLCDEDWYYLLTDKEYILPLIISEKTPEELIKKLNEQTIQFVPNDFFKGNPYIEFEMKNTNLRLYNMDKQLEAEEDLDSKRIVMASENKEYELGITIFKK